jgi:hypothetical protein
MVDIANEIEIKGCLIRNLTVGQNQSVSLLINEFPLTRLGTRVDLVSFSNNKFHAFEIKSAKDTLVRLQRQVLSLRKCFELVTIVVDRVHLVKALTCVSKQVGVIVFENGRLETYRNATPNRQIKSAILGLISQAGVKKLTGQKSKPNDRRTRSALEKHAMRTPLSSVRHKLVEELKSRYSTSYARCIHVLSNDGDDVQLTKSLTPRFAKNQLQTSYLDAQRRSENSWLEFQQKQSSLAPTFAWTHRANRPNLLLQLQKLLLHFHSILDYASEC